MFELKRSYQIKSLSTSVINKGYIPLVENSYNLIVGEGGTFKSFYALKSAVIYLLDNPTKNVFLALKEDGINENKRRLKMVCENMNTSHDEIDKRIFWNTIEEDNLIFVEKTSTAVLNNELLNDFIKAMILNDVGFIVLDTLKRMHRGLQENDSTDMQLLINGVFNTIPAKSNATLLVVHHSSKGDGSAVRGSSSISDDSRLTWALSRDIKKDSLTGKIVKDENATKIKLTLYKENSTASKFCKIRDENGYIDLPFNSLDKVEFLYQDKNKRYIPEPTVSEFKEDNISLNQTEIHIRGKNVFNDNPTITVSHKMAVDDYSATKDFNVSKMSFFDLVNMNIDKNFHYSSIQWKHGYRKIDNYISYEDFIIFDIDDGMTISEAKNVFQEYNAVIMPTKSHQVNKKGLKCDRFRVIIPYSEPLCENAEYSRLIKIEMFREVGADLQVASASSKFRGSPVEHTVIFLNGKKNFEWEKYKRIVNVQKENDRVKKEKLKIRRKQSLVNSTDKIIDIDAIKSSLSREIVSDIICSLGYEVNRQFKFKYRQDEKTPSASISNDLLIKDFGDDSITGDIINFVQIAKGIGFKESVNFIADFANISIKETKQADTFNMPIL